MVFFINLNLDFVIEDLVYDWEKNVIRLNLNKKYYFGEFKVGEDR